MPPYAPAVLIALVPQPVVAQHLRVVVVRLEAAVVHVRGAGPLEEEEAVVVDLFGALVEAEKDRDVLAGLVVDEFRGVEVEVGGEEVEFFLVVGGAEAEVAELVDRGGALLEALGLVDVAGLLAWLDLGEKGGGNDQLLLFSLFSSSTTLDQTRAQLTRFGFGSGSSKLNGSVSCWPHTK